MSELCFLICTADRSRKAEIQVSGTMTVEQLIQEAQRQWNLPEDISYGLRLVRTGQQLAMTETLSRVGSSDHDILEVYSLQEDQHENNIACIIRLADGTRKAKIQVPGTMTVEQFIQVAQQQWDLPEDVSYALRLARTGKELAITETLSRAGVLNADELEIYPILEAGGGQPTYLPLGQIQQISTQKYVCPQGDYTWYRRTVGASVPKCPTHKEPLRQVKEL